MRISQVVHNDQRKQADLPCLQDIRSQPKIHQGQMQMNTEEVEIRYKDDDILKNLEWIVASVHAPTLDTSVTKPDFETCTQLYLNAAENPYINVIGHCGTPEYAFDYEKVIPVFAEKGKLVEINDSAFKRQKSSIKNCIEIAKICKKAGAPIVVNTDAHFMTELGRADASLQMLEEIGFPEELVINSSVERFERYLTKLNLPLRSL